MWTCHQLVSPLEVLGLLEVLNDVPQECSLRMIDYQPTSQFLRDAEEIKGLAQFTVVPLFGLFNLSEILIQSLLGRK